MEQFANIGQATLNQGGTLSSGATSLTVTSEVNVPSSGTFRALIDSELIKVTAVSTHVWTITRADGGTTAVSHADGVPIYIVVTKEALNALVSIQANGTEISNRRVLNFLSGFGVSDDSGNSACKIISSPYNEILTPPVLANFTLDGHSIAGTPTATTQGNSIYIYHPGANGDTAVELYRSPPATPYTATAKILPFGLAWSFTSAGVYFGDGTKLHRFSFQMNNSNIAVDKYNTYSSFSATSFTQAASSFGIISWFKLTDSGTTKTYSISSDGQNWLQVYSGSSTEWLSTTTRLGVTLNGFTGGANNGRVAGLILQSWQVV